MTHPPFPTSAVANTVLDIAHEKGVKDVSLMKLQKLVYYAHGWYLAMTGKPLLDEAVEAWQYGPVVPSIYQCFKGGAAEPIKTRARDFAMVGSKFRIHTPVIHPGTSAANRAIEVLRYVVDSYSNLTAGQLSWLTHQKGGPWDQVYTPMKDAPIKGKDIPNDIIQAWFKAKAEQGDFRA